MNDTQEPMALVQQAEAALHTGQLQQAEQFMAKALQAAPNDAGVLTAFGSMLTDVRNTEKAVLTLRKAARLEPDSGHEKYMYLGQLLEDPEEAEAAYRKGIEILSAAIEEPGDPNSEGAAPQLQSELAAALCSLVELHIAHLDLDDLAEACEGCQILLKQARDAAPSSPEPMQTSARLLHELDRGDEALQCLHESMRLWRRPDSSAGGALPDAHAPHKKAHGSGKRRHIRVDATAAATRNDHDANVHSPCTTANGTSCSGDEAGPAELPSYEFRLECCKLLIELDSTTETAVQVAEQLLAENDGVTHAWYLLALAHYGGGAFHDAAAALADGRELIGKAAPQDADDEGDALALFVELQERIEEGLQLDAEPVD